MQIVLFRESAALEVAAVDLKSMLADGDYINFPYMTAAGAVTYTRDGAITNKDIFSGHDQLQVNTAKVVPIYVDDIDRVQNNWSVQAEHARRSQKTLNTVMDQLVNYTGYAAAASYVDAGNVGGTAGDLITMAVSNMDQLMAGIDTKLNELDVPANNRFAMFGPRAKAVLNRYIGGKETAMGDIIGANGKLTNRFGFELFYSNNNYYTATFTEAAAMTADTDTVTINGAVLADVTAVDAGTTNTTIEVLHNANTTASILNFSYAINDTGGTAGTEWGDNKLTNAAARWKLTKCGAYATVSANVLSLTAYGDIVISASMTDATNLWSAQTSHMLCGVKKAVKIVTQVNADIEVKDVYNKLGKNIFVWNLYGSKVPTDMEEFLIYAKIDATSWT